MNRAEIIERMARAISKEFYFTTWENTSEFRRGLCINMAATALSELDAVIPGISDVIEGKAVVVPVEATHDMRLAAGSLKVSVSAGGACDVGRVYPYEDGGDVGNLYAAMLAASPYNKP